MLPLQYAYLVGDISLLCVWFLIFIYRKDLRKEILFFSVIVALLSPIGAYLWWTFDWWHPLAFTGGNIGFEDLLVGFTMGGVSSVIYEEVYRKKPSKTSGVSGLKSFVFILLFGMVLIDVLFRFLNYTAFWATSIGMFVCGAIQLILRRDLIQNALMSGFLTIIACLPFYFLIMFLSPDWINATYDKSLTGFRPLGIPIEEFIFYFLLGFCFGPAWEYIRGKKLVKY